MDSAACGRNYQALANVGRALRSLKTIDLKVRPIHHRTADRVRTHIFLRSHHNARSDVHKTMTLTVNCAILTELQASRD